MKLRQWYAIHGAIEASPHPFELLQSLRPQVNWLDYNFEIENGEWNSGTFQPADAAVPAIHVHRIRPGEEGFLCGDSDGWERSFNKMLDEPHRESVLGHLRKVRQTVFLMPILTTSGQSQLARICEQLCGYMARASDGLIQVYEGGFFSQEGDSLLPLRPRHRLQTK